MRTRGWGGDSLGRPWFPSPDSKDKKPWIESDSKPYSSRQRCDAQVPRDWLLIPFISHRRFPHPAFYTLSLQWLPHLACTEKLDSYGQDVSLFLLFSNPAFIVSYFFKTKILVMLLLYTNFRLLPLAKTMTSELAPLTFESFPTF